MSLKNNTTFTDNLYYKFSIAKSVSELILNELADEIKGALIIGDRFRLKGVGTFETHTRHARGGVNPQKPSERITIPEVVVPKFRPSSTLKKHLKK